MPLCPDAGTRMRAAVLVPCTVWGRISAGAVIRVGFCQKSPDEFEVQTCVTLLLQNSEACVRMVVCRLTLLLQDSERACFRVEDDATGGLPHRACPHCCCWLAADIQHASMWAEHDALLQLCFPGASTLNAPITAPSLPFYWVTLGCRFPPTVSARSPTYRGNRMGLSITMPEYFFSCSTLEFFSPLDEDPTNHGHLRPLASVRHNLPPPPTISTEVLICRRPTCPRPAAAG